MDGWVGRKVVLRTADGCQKVVGGWMDGWMCGWVEE